MSQHEATPHSRSAIICDLACLVGEVASLQEDHARHGQQIAAMQSRLGRVIRDLSISTAISSTAHSLDDLRQQVGGLRRRLEGALEQNGPARTAAPASQAAPSASSPRTQNAGLPVKGGDVSDEVSGGEGRRHTTPDQSEEVRHDAGAGGASAASADTAPAADDPLVPRREPSVKTAGGGLLQDGGSRLPHGKQSDRVLHLYATTLMGPDQIAREIGCPVGNPSAYISSARRQGDTRAIQGDEARRKARLDHALELYATTDKSLKEVDALVGWRSGSTSNAIDEARASGDGRVLRGDERRGMYRTVSQPAAEAPPPITGTDAAPEPPKAASDKPKPASAVPAVSPQLPLKPPPASVDPGAAQKLLDDPERVIVADTGSGRIYGPLGSWQAIVRTAQSLAPLADGRLYGIGKVMKAGSWDKEADILLRLPEWKAGLASVGVELVHTKGIGLKLNRIAVEAA